MQLLRDNLVGLNTRIGTGLTNTHRHFGLPLKLSQPLMPPHQRHQRRHPLRHRPQHLQPPRRPRPPSKYPLSLLDLQLAWRGKTVWHDGMIVKYSLPLSHGFISVSLMGLAQRVFHYHASLDRHKTTNNIIDYSLTLHIPQEARISLQHFARLFCCAICFTLLFIDQPQDSFLNPGIG